MYIPTSQLDSIQITSQFSFQTYKTVFRPPPHCFSLFKPEILEDNTQVEQFISFQFSYSVMSDSLQPHGLQHARLPCPSPTPRVTQTQVPWVSDAIQPFHPLSSPSPSILTQNPHNSLSYVFQFWWSKLAKFYNSIKFQPFLRAHIPIHAPGAYRY